jgi:hypothetical protein
MADATNGAIMQELSVGRTLVGDALGNRCAQLAGLVATLEAEKKALIEQNAKQAEELAALKTPPKAEKNK